MDRKMHGNRVVLRPRLTNLQDGKNEQENLLRRKAVVAAKPTGQKRRALGETNKNVVAATKPPPQEVKKSIVISKPKKVDVKPKTTNHAAFSKPNAFVRPQTAASITSAKPLLTSTTTAATVTAIRSDSLPTPVQKVEDIDKDDRDDPFQVVTYVNDIFNYLRELETKFSIRPQHLFGQLHVTSKMRSILVDWLVGVHQQLHLVPETLYLTVAIIDLYLQETNETTKNTLQLVGVASMFLACKYEEIYSLEVSDFDYSKEEVFKMECKILKVLQFNLGRPVPITFFRRYSKAANKDAATHTMGKYLLELSIIEYDLCHYAPSLVAASAMYLALWLFSSNKKTVWNKTMMHYSTYSIKDVLPVAKKLALIVLNMNQSKYKAIARKYSSSRHLKISLCPELRTPQLKMFVKSWDGLQEET